MFNLGTPTVTRDPQTSGTPTVGNNWFDQFEPAQTPYAYAGSTSTLPNADPWQSFESILGVQQGGTLSPQMLLAKEKELNAAGITLIKNAAGLPGKVQFANGAAYDVIQGAGAGQNIYQRLPLNAAAGGSSGGPLSGLGSNGLSPEQIMQMDPGYQFRLGQGLDAIQKSAAARGTLLTGGTLKALNNYGQGFASNEFGDIYNRNLNLAKLGMPQ